MHLSPILLEEILWESTRNPSNGFDALPVEGFFDFALPFAGRAGLRSETRPIRPSGARPSRFSAGGH